MAQHKLPKRLFKNKDVVHAYQHDREAKSSKKHMTRDHVDVLQNIEAALVMCSRKDQSIDDRMVDVALEKAIQQIEPGEDTGPHVWMMYDLLKVMRANRDDVSDEIWRAGLRTVRDSVHRHSELRPGEKAYLHFVSQYVK
jgi:hypothetical protein